MLEVVDEKPIHFNYPLFAPYIYLKKSRIDRFEQTSLELTSTRPLLKVKYSSCPECGFPLKCFDNHRNETVCGHCGYVINTTPSPLLDKNITGRSTEPLPKNDGLLRRDEKKIIAKLQKQKYYTEKGDWRKKQYYYFAEKVVDHYKMRRGLDFLLLTIINKYRLKQLHSKCDFEKIILGVAIEILRQNGRRVPHNDSMILQIGLKTNERKVIRENLHSHIEFKKLLRRIYTVRK